MKNKFFITLFLLVVTNTYCQNFGGKIEYSVIFEDDKSLNNSEFSDFFKQAKDNSKYVNFILEFNKKEMLFFVQKIDVEGINTDYTIAFSNSNGTYYKKNKDNKLLHFIQDPLLGKVIILDTTKVDWKLLNEIKIIEGFKCYKAISSVKFNNGVGNFERQIIAWYCPNLPFSYGPKGFSLPGLILELQDKNVVFGAKKITFYDVEKVIDEPKGKTMTLFEYNDKLTKYFENEK